MFTKITPKTDSQLSNTNVVNLVLDDAINKIIQLTGVPQTKAFAMLVEQVNQQTKQEVKVKAKPYQQPVLEQNEYKFISNLFN